MGHIGEVPAEIERFVALANSRDAPPSASWRRVCEIGLNAGHSAMTLLASNERVHYVSFDMQSLAYSSAAVALLRRLFTSRVTFVAGDSSTTVAAYDGPACHILSIDGLHTYNQTRADLANFWRIAAPAALVLADDVTPSFGGTTRAWREAVDEGFVTERGCVLAEEKVNGYDKGWCWGTYDKSVTPSFLKERRK